jgi:glucose uptake protein GlcU
MFLILIVLLQLISINIESIILPLAISFVPAVILFMYFKKNSETTERNKRNEKIPGLQHEINVLEHDIEAGLRLYDSKITDIERKIEEKRRIADA